MKPRHRRFLVAFLLIQCFVVLAGCGDNDGGQSVTAASAVTESMDPGQLRTIMVQLGKDMSEVSRGLWLEDFSAVAIAATAIADHPHVSDTERTRIQAVLGADFGQFVKSDKHVHSAAVRLSTAATAHDLSATLEELTRLQAACVACHSDHRERLR